MIFPVVLFLVVPIAAVAGYFFPPLEWLGGARVFLLPTVFMFGALALPFSGMLGLSIFTGLFWDLLEIPWLSEGPELRPGWSVVVFAVLGALAQGFRPMFARYQGRWEVHCLLSGAGTVLYLIVQYAYLSFVRGLPEFHGGVWSRILGAGALALFAAPVIHFFLVRTMRMAGYEVTVETRPAFEEGP